MQMLMPVMALSTALLSVVWENLGVVVPRSSYFNSFPHLLVTLLLIGVGALVAFLMVWAEYTLIQKTSALTFIVAGTMKEVVTGAAADVGRMAL
jgi:solute carrier family 35, member C2